MEPIRLCRRFYAKGWGDGEKEREKEINYAKCIFLLAIEMFSFTQKAKRIMIKELK